MKIEDLKVGKLVYTIQADDANGEILESATEEKPRVMMFGVGRIMKSFSDGLRGLEAGDSFAFTITPDEAFGWHDDEKVMDAPLSIFMEDGQIREDLLVVGNVIKLQDKEGRPFDKSAADNIKKFGVYVIIGGVITNVCSLFSNVFEVMLYDMEKVFNMNVVSKITYDYKFDFSFVVIALLIFLLAHVFRYGEALQVESDETL